MLGKLPLAPWNIGSLRGTGTKSISSELGVILNPKAALAPAKNAYKLEPSSPSGICPLGNATAPSGIPTPLTVILLLLINYSHLSLRNHK